MTLPGDAMIDLAKNDFYNIRSYKTYSAPVGGTSRKKKVGYIVRVVRYDQANHFLGYVVLPASARGDVHKIIRYLDESPEVSLTQNQW